jgi:hypothetical protein
MGTLASLEGTSKVEYQIFKCLAMCDVRRRVAKGEIYNLIFFIFKMFHIFRILVRKFEGYNFISYSGEKIVELHMSPVFPSTMK